MKWLLPGLCNLRPKHQTMAQKDTQESRRDGVTGDLSAVRGHGGLPLKRPRQLQGAVKNVSRMQGALQLHNRLDASSHSIGRKCLQARREWGSAPWAAGTKYQTPKVDALLSCDGTKRCSYKRRCLLMPSMIAKPTPFNSIEILHSNAHRYQRHNGSINDTTTSEDLVLERLQPSSVTK